MYKNLMGKWLQWSLTTDFFLQVFPRVAMNYSRHALLTYVLLCLFTIKDGNGII